MATTIMEAAKNVLVAVAPTIASAFGTPMAGVATKAVLEALGLKKDSTDKELEAAILTANPEQLLAIKKADQEFKLQMKQLDVDLIKIVNEDRDSARNREAQVKDTTPKVLAYLLCMLYISVQIFLLTHVIPETMREMVMRALGTLDALLGLVFSYYFGSSVGEVKRQTETRELKKD